MLGRHDFYQEQDNWVKLVLCTNNMIQKTKKKAE